MNLDIPNGYEVDIFHYRHAPGPGGGLTLVTKQEASVLGREINPRGGLTIAQIVREDHEGWRVVICDGEAYCSENDNYNRKIGREIAVGRALKVFNEILAQISPAKP